MRSLFVGLMGSGLLLAAVGCCHLTTGVCDCDVYAGPHGHTLAPVPAAVPVPAAPTSRPEPIPSPKPAEKADLSLEPMPLAQ